VHLWIVQEIGGNVYLHGPYKGKDAQQNRYEKVEGGEVSKFDSFSDVPEVVRQEFMDEKVKKL